MRRNFTLYVMATLLVMATTFVLQIQAQYTYVVVHSDEFESEFRNWSNGSAEGLDTEKKYFVDQNLNRRQSLLAAQHSWSKTPLACTSATISVLSVILYAPIRLDILI